jgi:signal transduction histidine kinase
MIRTLLANLIGNCWKYGSERPNVSVEFGSKKVDGRDAFFVRGTGGFVGGSHGLTSVNRIVSRHGGRVWSKSGTDKSLTFYFTLQP